MENDQDIAKPSIIKCDGKTYMFYKSLIDGKFSDGEAHKLVMSYEAEPDAELLPTAAQLVLRALPNNTFFWAKDFDMQKIVTVKKEYDGSFMYPGWECPIKDDSFEFMKLIELPEGFTAEDIY